MQNVHTEDSKISFIPMFYLLDEVPKAFRAAFPRIFRESGSFSASAKCRILTDVFVGLAEYTLQAQMPAR